MPTRLAGTLVRLDAKWSRLRRLSSRFFRHFWTRLLSCPSIYSPVRYRRLRSCFADPQFSVLDEAATAKFSGDDSDLVALKITLLGDRHIGKTSFMVKYVGDLEQHEGIHMTGLNLMDKILLVKGARIAISIWDVGGDDRYVDHVPIACKDASAILIMFDLTVRRTLNNVGGWFRRARKWNKTAIPVLIGTKFDDFAQLPVDMQVTIVNEILGAKLIARHRCTRSSIS